MFVNHILCFRHVNSLFGTLSCSRFPETLGKGIVVYFELGNFVVLIRGDGNEFHLVEDERTSKERRLIFMLKYKNDAIPDLFARK